jgi:hypothetical protein
MDFLWPAGQTIAISRVRVMTRLFAYSKNRKNRKKNRKKIEKK